MFIPKQQPKILLNNGNYLDRNVFSIYKEKVALPYLPVVYRICIFDSCLEHRVNVLSKNGALHFMHELKYLT